MGNSSSSSSSDPRFNSACRAFTEKELEDLKSLFMSLASQSQSNAQFITPSVFMAYVGFDGALGDRLFDLVTQKRRDQKLTFQDLIIAKATYEKGTKEEIEEFIYQLLDVSDDGIVERSDIEKVVAAIFSEKTFEPEAIPNETTASILVAANFEKRHEGNVEGLSFDNFRRWCTLLPSVRKFLGSLLSPSDLGSQVPHLVHLENIKPNMVLLKKVHAWIVGGAVSLNGANEWKLLYHSSLHGQSFNTFLGSIKNHEGPTVMVIKDKEGFIYGGYASQPWEKHADFYGDMKSFLFQLHPRASVFRPTGANHNLQWCAVNFSSESIPNGLGFGGQINHFGLFLSANFDRGHTFECTTFGSPCLSKTNQIYPEVIECWVIQSKGAQQEGQEGVRGTVLERYKEDRNMLNLVGLANSSE